MPHDGPLRGLGDFPGGRLDDAARAPWSLSTLQLSRDLDVQYRTAWELDRKIRNSIRSSAGSQGLGGEMEIDITYPGGHVDGSAPGACRREPLSH
jgi:hypothetical protein